MKAIYWNDETMGAEYDVEDIPADLVDLLINGVMRCFRKLLILMMQLMEKYFDDPSTRSQKKKFSCYS
jgi:elongation factor G